MSRIIEVLQRKLDDKMMHKELKKSEKDFTRERKLGIKDIVNIIIRNIKKPIQIEIEKYIKDAKMKEEYSRQAFSKARKKIRAEGIKYLSNEVTKEYYKSNELKRFRNYLVLAIDGSVLTCPIEKELQSYFGTIDDKNEKSRTPLCQTSVMYDVENHLIMDSSIERYKYSERKMAEEHIEYLKSNYDDVEKILIIFDRGYPSVYLLKLLDDSGIKYLFRIHSAFIKEAKTFIKESQELDVEKILEFKKENRKLSDKRVFEKYPNGFELRTRFLRIKLNTGNDEYLMTNIYEEEFEYEIFMELYAKRWLIETNYGYIKTILDLENFSGKTPEIIKQDFYASVMLNNLISNLSIEIDEEIKQEVEQNSEKYKYTEYKVNMNLLTGLVKEDFFILILEKNRKKRTIVIERIKKKLKTKKIAVIKGRKFVRNIPKRNKNPFNTKKSF